MCSQEKEKKERMQGGEANKKKAKGGKKRLLRSSSFLADLFDLGDVERLAGAPFERDRPDARHLPSAGVVREEDRDGVDRREFRHFQRLRRPFPGGLGAQLKLGSCGVGLGLGEAERGPVDEDADFSGRGVGVGGLDRDGGELDGW